MQLFPGEPLPPSLAVEPHTAGRPLLVASGGCMYAVASDESSRSHLFCGAPLYKRSSYCVEHHALCWKPYQKRDRIASQQPNWSVRKPTAPTVMPAAPAPADTTPWVDYQLAA